MIRAVGICCSFHLKMSVPFGLRTRIHSSNPCRMSSSHEGVDTDTKPTETTQEVVKEEVEGKFDQDEESFDDLDSIIGDIFSDYEEESNEE